MNPIEAYYKFLETKSEHTARAYRTDLGKFFDYFSNVKKDVRAIENITPAEFREFVYSLDGLSENSKNRVIRVVNAFISWLLKDEYIDTEKISRVEFGTGRTFKVNRGKPVFLNSEQVRAIIDACDTVQDKFMVAFMCRTGLRRDEAASLKISDIDEETRKVIVRHGKGDKYREVAMPETIWNFYQIFKATRSPEDGEYLFFSTRRKTESGQITGNSINNRFQSAVQKSNLPDELKEKLHAHSMRSTALSFIIEQTGSVELARQIAGHSSVAVTELYNATNSAVDTLRNLDAGL